MLRFKNLLKLTIVFGFLLSSQLSYADEVMIVTWRGKTDAELGFKERLKELHPKAKFTHIDAARDRVTLANALRSTDFSDVRLVYSFGTTGSKLTKTALRGRVPHVFNIVSTPILSNIVETLNKPGDNITGVRHTIDVETQFNVMLRLKDIKTLGVWFDPREFTTVAQANKIKELAKQNNIEVKKFRVIVDAPNFETLIKEASEKAKDFDALYIPSGSGYIEKSDKMLANIDPSVFVFGAVNQFVGHGATVALASDYKERGKAAAELASLILKGAQAGTLPVDIATIRQARIYIDKKRAVATNLQNVNELGLQVIEQN